MPPKPVPEVIWIKKTDDFNPWQLVRCIKELAVRIVALEAEVERLKEPRCSP